MRSALGKELRKQFASEMSRTFPEFVEIKIPRPRPGSRMYVRRTPQVSFYILMWPLDNRDESGIMYGWSSSAEPPREQHQYGIEHPNILNHDGCLFRIMKVINQAGARGDRFWILNAPMDVAFERTVQEFGKPGDTEIDTLERAVNQGLSYMMSNYHETPVEKLIPKIPELVKDCMNYIHENIIPYFEKVSRLRSNT
jgi:hypothetical protein